MNHLFFIILLSTFTSFYCAEIKQNIPTIPAKNNLELTIVDSNNKPTEPLLAILSAASIEHDGTLQNIFAETQKKWLRPAGQERWEEQSSLNFSYDHLIELSNNGTHFDSIIILAGHRPLDKNLESHEALLNNNYTGLPSKDDWHFNGQFPTTETEMMKFVFDQTEVPTVWNSISLIFVDTPMQTTENGSLRRPNTQDTVDEWIKTHKPQPGSILAISDQPYIGYQDAVLRKALPKDFAVETVGKACSDDKKPTIIFDSLARWIYNEHHIILQRNN